VFLHKPRSVLSPGPVSPPHPRSLSAAAFCRKLRLEPGLGMSMAWKATAKMPPRWTRISLSARGARVGRGPALRGGCRYVLLSQSKFSTWDSPVRSEHSELTFLYRMQTVSAQSLLLRYNPTLHSNHRTLPFACVFRSKCKVLHHLTPTNSSSLSE